MRPSRAIAFWVAVIAALLFIEVAELTRLFTLPVQSAVGNLLSFVFALVFTTILALIGALFVGIYISQRMQSPGGFTRFEEEMLKMRGDVERLARDLTELRRSLAVPPSEEPREGRP
ncbi:MAG TPA: hypothetical protein VJQ43_05275 [Thermoplasmata archaeon]|nr:hypothetical protein [Thermoplasmata archaeon]